MYSPSGRWGSPVKELTCKLVSTGGSLVEKGSRTHASPWGRGSDNMWLCRKSSRAVKLELGSHKGL